MLHPVVDASVGVAKESAKAINQEMFSHVIKLVNGLSALAVTLLPGNKIVLEGLTGWELRPTYGLPCKPQWMEEGVSSFNALIYEHGTESDSEQESDDEPDEEYESASSSTSSSSLRLFQMSTQHFQTDDFRRQERRLYQTPSLGHFFQGVKNPFIYVFPKGTSSSHKTSTIEESDRKKIARSVSSIHTGNLRVMHGSDSKPSSTLKDFVLHRTTDSRRRGVIEDLQVLGELAIEKIFDAVHKVLYQVFFPLETFCFQMKANTEDPMVISNLKSSILGKYDSAPAWLKPKADQPLNTDSRTCQDIIMDLGYPYEAFKVTTEDGYILLLERIPRHDSQKVLFLQHGMFDSSLGWVCNGVVGSLAFAAYDQGYDVFLGNLRGLSSKEHVDKGISAGRYYSFTANEYATQDVPAMIDRIHILKISELTSLSVIPAKEFSEQPPYKLCMVAHSLAGAVSLMYVVTRCFMKRPHRISRLICFSPAGFDEDSPASFQIMAKILPPMAPFLRPLIPGLYVPTRFLRMLLNKFSRDIQNYPGLGGLAQRMFSYCVGGDCSNWMGAVGVSHYNMYEMPGVSFPFAEHVAQWINSGKFSMFDYGSESANLEAYGTPFPFNVAEHYHVIDIPVDVVAGSKDRLIPASMVHKHYTALLNANVKATYTEFDFAHLDFTFGNREENLMYVLDRLQLVASED